MTATGWQFLLYAGGMAALWAVPGPVWVALTARTLAGGFASAWPLAVGVALGDAVWPVAAVLGLSAVGTVWGDALTVLRWVAAAVFLGMGAALLRRPDGVPQGDGGLTRPGARAGFLVGVAAVVGNPKAILFYMGALPGFFDIGRLTAGDVLAIAAISAVLPMAGNLGLALFIDRARQLLASPAAMRRMRLAAGAMLVGVGLAIPFV